MKKKAQTILNTNFNKIYKYLFPVAIILIYFCVPIMITIILTNSLGMDSKIIVSSIASILTLLILILIFNRTLIKQFYDFKQNWKKYMTFTVKCWAIGIVVMMVSNLIINYVIFGGNTIAGNEEKVRELLVKYPIYGLFSAAIFAPIAEEITFRLSFRKWFKSALMFAIVTGLLFASLHLVGSYTSIKDLLYLIPYGSLGFAFGYAYFKTDNIFSTMTMHFIHNFVVYGLIIIVYLGV